MHTYTGTVQFQEIAQPPVVSLRKGAVARLTPQLSPADALLFPYMRRFKTDITRQITNRKPDDIRTDAGIELRTGSSALVNPLSWFLKSSSFLAPVLMPARSGRRVPQGSTAFQLICFGGFLLLGPPDAPLFFYM